MAKTIQDHYNLIKEGKGNKDLLLRKIKEAYPNYIPNHFTLEQAIPILKQKGILHDSKVIVTENKNWSNIFKKNISEAKTPSKEAVESETKGFDFKDKSNIDNIYGQAFLIGYYAEMKDPKNADKTIDDLKAIVAKNIEKDPLYYVKDGQFGVKGVGYKDDLPGLKLSKTDQMTPVPDQVKLKASKTDLGDREKKTGAAKKVKGEMSVVSKSSRGVKKMALPGKEKKIKLKEAWVRSIISKIIKEELNELDFPESPDSLEGTEWDIHTSKYNKKGRERSRFVHDREAKSTAEYINSTFSKKINNAQGILELEEVEEELLGTLMKFGDDEEVKTVVDGLLEKISQKQTTFLNENPTQWKDSKKGTVKLSKDKANPSDIKKYTDQDIDVDLTENEEIYQQIEDLENELLNTTDPERAKEIEAKLDALTKQIA